MQKKELKFTGLATKYAIDKKRRLDYQDEKKRKGIINSE